MNSGRILSGSPCLGSWVNYGLGTVNEDLPGFVVMLDPRGGPISGAKNWSSGYMPAIVPGHRDPLGQANRSWTSSLRAGFDRSMQRDMLDTLRRLQRRPSAARAVDNSDLAARIASYELAYKMQAAAPESVDLSREDARHARALYGLNDKKTEVFGRQCLLARRLVERGVRFIQIYSGGNHNDDNWDAHGDLVANHDLHAGETDKPIAGLLKDLKQRGIARRNADRLGRRIRPAADGRIREGHRPRSQRLRFHDVDGRRWDPRRAERRLYRRTGQRGGRKPLARQNACTPRFCTSSAWTRID